MADAKEIAKVLVGGKALRFSVREPFTYVTGIKSPIYMDCRTLIGDVKRRRIIVDAFAEVLEGLDFDYVAATASGAIAWGAWVADRLDVPMVYVRKKSKGHGTKKLIEGFFEKDSKAVVVEDLVSTGKSSLAAVKTLRHEGFTVENVVSIFSYGMADSIDSFKSSEVKLISLSNFDSAVQQSIASGTLSEDDAKAALAWIIDPKGWSP